MKRLTASVLALFVFVCFSQAETKTIIGTSDFLYSFNLNSAAMNSGHELSTDSVEISYLSDDFLLKKVYNGCESLSLVLTSDTNNIKAIRCTWSTAVPGSSKYQLDFTLLLMETLIACGVDLDAVMVLLLDIGSRLRSVGDKGSYTIDGLNIVYEVSSGFGASLFIERA